MCEEDSEQLQNDNPILVALLHAALGLILQMLGGPSIMI